MFRTSVPLCFLLLFVASPAPARADVTEPPADVTLASEARSAQALALPTGTTPAAGAVTLSLQTALVFSPALAPTLSYSPSDAVAISAGGLYWLDQGVGVGGRLKVRVARSAAGRLHASLIGGGGYFGADGPTPGPFGFGGGAVSACLGSPCDLLLSGFGAALLDRGSFGVWAGGSALIKTSNFVQLVVGYWAHPVGFPVAAAAVRLTPGRWTLDLGMNWPIPASGGTIPLPYLSLGYTF